VTDAPPADAEAPPAETSEASDLKWHVPPENNRFLSPETAERERPFHLIPSIRFRSMYMLDAEEIEVESTVRFGLEVIAGTFGVVTVGGDPTLVAGVEGLGFVGLDVFDNDGFSAQVLLPDIELSAIFDRDLILRAGSGLTGFRVNQCMGPIIMTGQLRLPIIDVWMVPDDDFEDPVVSVGTMLEIGIAL
jgi:hypothetical protein